MDNTNQGNLPNIDVRVYPQNGRDNLLAFASVNIGGVFAVNDVRVMDSAKGKFVAMPSRKISKDGKTEYRDICFPTTKEMRTALQAAVLGAYEKAVSRESVHDAMREAAKESVSRAASAPARTPDLGAR